MKHHVRHTAYQMVGVLREHAKHSNTGTHPQIRCPVAQVLLSLLRPLLVYPPEVSHQMKLSSLSQQLPACISPEIKNGISVTTESNSPLELIRKQLVVEEYPWIVVSLVKTSLLTGSRRSQRLPAHYSAQA